MPISLQEEFFSLLEKRLLKEEDIFGCESEVDKISLEKSYADGRRYPFTEKIQYGFTKEQTTAEKYRLVERLDRSVNNLFFDQTTRERIDFTLHILIRTSEAYENVPNSFPRIIRLLSESKERPYLVWEISLLISRFRPEIIPYLFAHSGLQELGALLIPTFDLNPYSIQHANRENFAIQLDELRYQLNNEGLIALLSGISTQQGEDAAVVLSGVIIEVSKSVFSFPSNFDIQKQKRKQVQIRNYTQIWEIISRFRIETYQFVYAHGSDNPLLILNIIDGLYKEIVSRNRNETFNESYTPDIWEIDLLIKLREKSPQKW